MTLPTRPKGKENVMNAILDAATAMFAEKGVAGVSIRDIAAKANVNHGLVHRHFGSKENLRLHVQNRLMRIINADIGDPDNYEDAIIRGVQALRQNEAFWKVLARTFLDGQFTGDVQSSFPFLKKMTAFIDRAQRDGTINRPTDPRVLVAGGVAMVLGMLVFENYLLPGTGLDDQPLEKTQEILLKTYD